MASDGDDSVPYVTAFGSRVSESEPLTVVLRSGPLTLSNAALSLVHARKQQAPTTLCAKCEGWEESIVLCTLFPTSIPQTMLNVTFAQGNEEVLLSVVGPATIHVTGSCPCLALPWPLDRHPCATLTCSSAAPTSSLQVK